MLIFREGLKVADCTYLGVLKIILEFFIFQFKKNDFQIKMYEFLRLNDTELIKSFR